MALNLEKQLVFYGSYHHNPVNKAVHIVCVPMILCSAFMLGTKSGSLLPMPEWAIIPNLPPNLGTIATLLYTTLYVLMEPVAGGILAPILLGWTAYANYLTTEYGLTATYWASGAQAFSWVAQFIGHGAFEGRAPALLDNLVQALFLAPFFVWMEILFMMGYRPELKTRVDANVEKEIARFRNAKQKGDVTAINGNGKAK